MKTWTMPSVAVEAFRANEYVAGSCQSSFATNEQQIYSIMASANELVDFDEGRGGWGANFDITSIPGGVKGQYTRGDALTQYQWDHYSPIGPYLGYVELATQSETEAQSLKDQGLIFKYHKEGRYIFGQVNVYWFSSNTGGNHWHPSTMKTSIQFS